MLLLSGAKVLINYVSEQSKPGFWFRIRTDTQNLKLAVTSDKTQQMQFMDVSHLVIIVLKLKFIEVEKQLNSNS